MAAVAVAVAAIVILSLVVLYVTNRTRRLINKVPGPPTLPVIGNAHQFKPGGSGFLEQTMGYYQAFKTDGMYKLWFGIYPVVLLFRADCVETLLASTKHIDKSNRYDFLHPWLGTGLLTSTGQKWKTRRRLLTPTFHFKILSDFVSVFNEQSDILVAKLRQNLTKEGFDIYPDITACALDIICESAMGKSVNAQQFQDSAYVAAVYRISKLIQVRQSTFWMWPDFIYNTFFDGKEHKNCLDTLHGFTEEVIKERMVEFKKTFKTTPGKKSLESGAEDSDNFGQKKRMAFLDMLLHASEGETKLSFRDIREEVDTFMFEGHDTTASGMAWAIFLIGCHPEVQEKLHTEMLDIFGDESRHVTMEDLSRMNYLEQVLKESLRLYPSVPFFARTLVEDTMIGGYLIPKGTDVSLFTHALHRDPNYFPDPEKFDPDRFLPDNCAGRHPYSYAPFSAGFRNCIGQRFALMEEKVVLSALLRNFRIESLCKQEELRPICELILKPENGVNVKLKVRE